MDALSLFQAAMADTRVLIVAIPVVTIWAACALTFLWTTLLYHLTMRRNNSSHTLDVRPPVIPYTIPWLGSALAFLTPHPGKFFGSVLAWHPPALGYFGIVLAGEVSHIVYSSRAVQSMFKVKSSVAHRDHFNKDVILKGFGLGQKDYDAMVAGSLNKKRELDEEMNQEFLLRQSAVNELTKAYIDWLGPELAAWRRQMQADTSSNKGGVVVVDLYMWLRTRMFKPSVTAFFGERIVRDTYPEFAEDFWKFDTGMLDMFFGVPKLFRPEPYAVRERLITHMATWIERGDELLEPHPHNPETEWEPVWGSRLSRARAKRFISEGVSSKGRGALELGFLFGLLSNAIPLTAWMLMHILDPAKPDLLPGVLNELRRAVISSTDAKTPIPIEDLKFDINIVIAQPLLLSIYQECMRMYVDVLVTRKAEQDFRVPLDSTTPDGKTRMLLIKKGENVIAPSIISHYDESFFTSPPPDVFDPHRFLVPASPENGGDGKQHRFQDEYAFSTTATSSKLWHYGGGKTMCPGRVFAKQEILATVASVLLGFEVSADDPSSYAIPGFSNAYGGSAGIVPGGDVRVKIRLR